jgi:16S rRNA (uracil1498-N3)-methyltransferase
MRLHRFYIQQPLGEGILRIEIQELIHQWMHVFRYTKGDHVLLFSPDAPKDYEYEIISATKKEVVMSYIQTIPNINSPSKKSLFMALVKKDTFETIVRHATEIGITDIYPVLSARSEKKNINFTRLQTIAREASEQSGRGVVPYIHPITSFSQAVIHSNDAHIIFDSTGSSLAETTQIKKEAIWIGPEGGWTTDEMETFTQLKVTIVSLGETTLKADTAAILGVGILMKSL